MVTTVFIVAIFNLLLGVALALYVPQWLNRAATGEDLNDDVDGFSSRLDSQNQAADSSAASTPAEVLASLPDDWQEILGGEVPVRNFVEASVHVLRLEVGEYRATLMGLEQEARSSCHSGNRAKLEECLELLKEANVNWLHRQQEASKYLKQRQGSLGTFSDIGGRLEEVLVKQVSQIETSMQTVDELDFENDFGAACDYLMAEICKFIDFCHVLRDRMHEALLAIVKNDGTLLDLEANLQFDPGCQVYNRSGIEALFERWWADDPAGSRPVALVLINIDRFGTVNRLYGTRVGDQMLAAFSILLTECLRQNRGYDRVGRLEGDKFVAFLGDTGPRAAACAIERIRQTIESSSFLLGEEDLSLTLSASVVELLRRDTVASLLDRAVIGIEATKRRGGNCTLLADESREVNEITPPDFDIHPQSIRIDANDSDNG